MAKIYQTMMAQIKHKSASLRKLYGLAVLFMMILLASAGNEVSAATYTWQGADGGSWIVSTNWNPERITPATDDILQFSDGTTKVVTALPAETIGQLIFSNNTKVILQSASSVILSIGGGTGTDLDIPAGSALIIAQATNAITISVLTGATGLIGGSITYSTAAHKLLAANSSGITFQNGSVFKAGLALSGSPFGTTSNLSIIFESGSTYLYYGGSNPFGATQPASVVVFQAGSLYKHKSGGSPSFSGRTYANFEMDTTLAITPTGGAVVSINNLTITSGTLNFNMTGTPGHSIKGNITVATGATLNFNPLTAGTVNLNGTTAQTITGGGTINSSGTLSTINIANASGVLLNAAAKFNNLSITSGTFTTASGASLITTGTVPASVIVQRSVNAWTDAAHGWHLLSSPVVSQTIDPAFTDGIPANYDFYKWDEVTNLWLNFKDGGFTSFVPGTGYLVAYYASSTKQFDGTLNTANVTASGLTISGGANSGWNLVGNPFPCALKWNDGTNWIVPAEIAGTAKIWDEPTAAYVDIAANGFIPAMNGFMVQVLSGSPASLTIPIAARVHNTTPWYKSTEGSITLIAYDRTNNTAQQNIILLNELATEGYDAAYDSRFLAGYAPQFYSVAGDEFLSSNTLPDLDNGRVIELGFVKNSADDYSIGLNTENMISGLVIYLTDKKTGSVTELSQGIEYTFTASEGDDANRFLLHFGPLGIDDPAAYEIYNIYSNAGNIYIASQLTSINDVMVINLLGQVVMRCQTNGAGLTTINASGLENGVYLVSVMSGSQVINHKVIISR